MSKKRERSPWKQQLEAERLRALERPAARRLPDVEASEEVRTASRQARFGPKLDTATAEFSPRPDVEGNHA